MNSFISFLNKNQNLFKSYDKNLIIKLSDFEKFFSNENQNLVQEVNLNDDQKLDFNLNIFSFQNQNFKNELEFINDIQFNIEERQSFKIVSYLSIFLLLRKHQALMQTASS